MFDYLSDITFLAGSENRLRMLDAVANTAYNRYELERELGISRATTVRILAGLEERAWAESIDGRYQTTPLGDEVLTAFVDFHDAVAKSQRLASIAPWVSSVSGVGLEHLSDASITVPTQADSVAPIRRAIECMREASVVRGVSGGIAPEPLRVNRDCVVDEGQSFEVVFSTEVMDIIRSDPSMSKSLVDILEAGGRVYEHDVVPHHYGLFDNERVGIGLVDDAGAPQAYVVSDNREVVDWASSTFERFRSRATLVTIDDDQ